MTPHRRCEAFNRRYPVGTAVTVKKNNGDLFTTTTRSEAWPLGSDSVIMIDGIPAVYLLDRVSPVKP